MQDSPGQIHAVTGAFSYTGKYIARQLAADGIGVRALVRRFPGDSAHGYDCRALQFGDRDRLAADLDQVDVLYNTYWIRFERGPDTFARAVTNTAILAGAARDAGVRRIVHISVSNPSNDSPFGYFRGKAAAETAVEESGVGHSIIRPTLVFGREDILVNNIAWLLRRFHAFAVPGDGAYQVQPVYVEDVAGLAMAESRINANRTIDAAGPEIFRFDRFVELLGDAVGARAVTVHAPLSVALVAGRALSVALRDDLITREELGALMAGLLVSHAPPTAATAFGDWLRGAGAQLGSTYTSELRRHWAGVGA